MTRLSVEGLKKSKRQRKDRLESALGSIVSQLERMGARKVMFFGSLAEDNVNSKSDLDILVVMPPDRPGKEWIRHIYKELERDVATDMLVFNTTEFEEELQKNALLKQVMKKGKVLLEKDS